MGLIVYIGPVSDDRSKVDTVARIMDRAKVIVDNRDIQDLICVIDRDRHNYLIKKQDFSDTIRPVSSFTTSTAQTFVDVRIV